MTIPWGRLVGRTPSDQQFEFWSVKHSPEVIKQGILNAAQTHLSSGRTMSDDHKLRFASKVMLTLSTQREQHARNREKLRQQFEGRVQQ